MPLVITLYEREPGWFSITLGDGRFLDYANSEEALWVVARLLNNFPPPYSFQTYEEWAALRRRLSGNVPYVPAGQLYGPTIKSTTPPSYQ